MIKIKKELGTAKKLCAIDCCDELSKARKDFEIFNISMDEYYIVINKNDQNMLNEIYRSIQGFISKQTNEFEIEYDSFKKFDENNSIIAVLIDSLVHGSSEGWTLKTNKKNELNHFIIISNDQDEKQAQEYLIIANEKTFVRYLQDLPSNIMNPTKFENEIKNHFKELKNVEIEVLTAEQLKQKNMNLILAVGQGCNAIEEQTRIVVIKYLNNKYSNDINCFIGKGICFDTGGLNIKTSNYMRWMKYDMSGSAIVSGIISSLAKNNIETNIIGVCALATNLCGSGSYRPDDVLVSYNGLTVEIDNTDAEGRLVMADAISYAAKDLKATKIFDIATLTGAMTYALGDTYTGVWTNDELMWTQLNEATKKSGELVWRLPFHHDFKDLLKSNFADICNSVSDPRGGSSRAAMFLKEFTNNLPYMHFDVASTADKGNVGTGIMVHTMYNFFKNN